jgi:hypothetical protein
MYEEMKGALEDEEQQNTKDSSGVRFSCKNCTGDAGLAIYSHKDSLQVLSCILSLLIRHKL